MVWISVDCYSLLCPLIALLMRERRLKGLKGSAFFQTVVSGLRPEAGGRLPVAASEKIGKLQMEAMVGYKR